MTVTPSISNAAVLVRSATATLAESLTSAVVQVRNQNSGSGGAGLIWGCSGLVVTNAHCVPRGATMEVGHAKRWREARVVAYHPPHDLALLEAGWTSGTSDTWTSIRDVESLRAGELLFALGHPLGVRDSLAMGVLHDVARDRRTGTPRWVVADIRLAPGNSGGPLVDAEGRLVGINSMVVSGLGVAVPAEMVRQFVGRVLAKRAA
jgi:serine protease Do